MLRFAIKVCSLCLHHLVPLNHDVHFEPALNLFCQLSLEMSALLQTYHSHTRACHICPPSSCIVLDFTSTCWIFTTETSRRREEATARCVDTSKACCQGHQLSNQKREFLLFMNIVLCSFNQEMPISTRCVFSRIEIVNIGAM
jgi:hypothetical protein